jgi:hypothetical protein
VLAFELLHEIVKIRFFLQSIGALCFSIFGGHLKVRRDAAKHPEHECHLLFGKEIQLCAKAADAIADAVRTTSVCAASAARARRLSGCSVSWGWSWLAALARIAL